MRLTLVLFRRNRMPNGHIFRGKDRLVKKVEPKHLRKLDQEFALEEQNMFYLRYPYLSEAESAGHAKALGKRQQKCQQLIDIQKRVFKNDVTIYERLAHLRVKESWE